MSEGTSSYTLEETYIVAYTRKLLAKLQKVDLRNAWSHEALDFTNWLAQEENLGQLSCI